MPTEPDIDDALATLATDIDKTKRDILDEIDDTTETGDDVSGYVFSHGDDQLVVYGVHGDHFFTLQNEFDITPRVAGKLKVEDQGGVPDDVEEFGVEIEDEDIDRARQYIAQVNAQRDPEMLSKAQRKLTQMLSHPQCAYVLLNELNGPHGFALQKKIFVHEDSYSTSRFDEACQTLVSLAQVPQNFLGTVYNTDIDGDSSTGGDTPGQGPGPRGFQ